jgi:hypothetical protein
VESQDKHPRNQHHAPEIHWGDEGVREGELGPYRAIEGCQHTPAPPGNVGNQHWVNSPCAWEIAIKRALNPIRIDFSLGQPGRAIGEADPRIFICRRHAAAPG